MVSESLKLKNPQAEALVVVLMSVGCYSLIPLILDLFGSLPPVQIFAFLTLSISLCMLFWMLASVNKYSSRAGYFRVLLGWRLIGACWRVVPWSSRLLALLSGTEFLFFVWSARLVDAAVTTIIFEFWPVVFLATAPLLRRFLGGSDQKGASERGPSIKERVPFANVVLVILAGAGLALVVAAEGFRGSAPVDGRKEAFIGLALAAVSLSLAGLSASLSVVVGEKQHHDASDEFRTSKEFNNLSTGEAWRLSERSSDLTALGLSAVVVIVPRVAVGCSALIWVVLVEGTSEGSRLSLIAAIAGLAAGACAGSGAMLLRRANHLSRSDAINSLYYATPVLALAWLWLFTDVVVDNVAMFLVGAAGVVAINMALHLDPEGTRRSRGLENTETGTVTGHGFKALMVALWVSGAVIVLRDDLLPESMLGWSMPEYWGLLALGATVFVLLLSFRQARLAERHREADRVMLSVHAEINACFESGLINHSRRKFLLKMLSVMDSGREVKDIRRAYLKLRKGLLGVGERGEHRAKLWAMLRDVEIFANLRQGERNFAELMVMTLFAVLTVFLALFVRPQWQGTMPYPWAGFATELFLVAFASAIGFLVFDLIDRRRARDQRLLKTVLEVSKDEPGPLGWRLDFISATDPTAHRVVSAMLGAAVFLLFTALLHAKWF